MIQVTNGYVTIKIVKRELKKYLANGYKEIKNIKSESKEKTDNEQDNTKSKSKQG